jgi:diguanylate cyclase (GGDEF)-like protein
LCHALATIDLLSIADRVSPAPIRDLTRDAAWHAALNSPQTARFASYRALPLTSGSRAVGAIVVLSEAASSEVRDAEVMESARQLATLAVERRELYEQLSYRARHDNMTTLLNRAALYERLESEIRRSAKSSENIGVIYLDLNDFKGINDRFGHAAGDIVLREVSDRISRCVRHSDLCARVGGDEFVVVLPKLRAREEAERIADLIGTSINEGIQLADQEVMMSASIGISIFPEDGLACDALLRAADESMYKCKRVSRKRELLEA